MTTRHNVLNELEQVGCAGKTLVEGTVNKSSTVKVNGEPAQVVSMPGSSLWKFEKQIDVTVG